jgi:hypothetical protein
MGWRSTFSRYLTMFRNRERQPPQPKLWLAVTIFFLILGSIMLGTGKSSFLWIVFYVGALLNFLRFEHDRRRLRSRSPGSVNGEGSGPTL